ncbi:MAG: coenzyme F420-0:L-glutamate ligase [Candidatus Hodarchaeota archaeon]
MELLPIKTPIFRPGMNISDVISDCLKRKQITLKNGDVLVIASKILATVEGRIIPLKEVIPSKKAQELATETGQDPRFVQLVLDHSETILGQVPGAILTYTSGIMQANAGIDRSNVGHNLAILLPKNPEQSAKKIRADLEKEYGVKLGLIISDSKTNPLRRGTTGLALAISGFEPIKDDRGGYDLFGYEMKVTFRAVADNLTCAAQILMGETNEQIPVVLIRDAPIVLRNVPRASDMFIAPEQCLYSSLLKGKDLLIKSDKKGK